MRSKSKPVDRSGLDRIALIEAALGALPDAYAPYSRFSVAAATLWASGKIYTGTNVENASYPAGSCAERTAMNYAASKGERKLVAIAIAGGPDGAVKDYCPPCGVCRQVMREFADPKECVVLLAKSPEDYKEFTLEQLLPESFGPEDLNK